MDNGRNLHVAIPTRGEKPVRGLSLLSHCRRNINLTISWQCEAIMSASPSLQTSTVDLG